MLSILSIDSSESWYSDTESVDTTVSPLSIIIRPDEQGTVSLDHNTWTLSSESPSSYCVHTTTDVYMVVYETDQSSISLNGIFKSVSRGTILYLNDGDQITMSGMMVISLSPSNPAIP